MPWSMKNQGIWKDKGLQCLTLLTWPWTPWCNVASVSVQGVGPTRDPRYLVPKQTWSLFYRPRNDEILSQPCAALSRTSDQQHDRQVRWPLCHWSSLVNITKTYLRKVCMWVMFVLLGVWCKLEVMNYKGVSMVKWLRHHAAIHLRELVICVFDPCWLRCTLFVKYCNSLVL